jgi:hypothetical protein
MPKKTLLQIMTHHRQNPLDFSNSIIKSQKDEGVGLMKMGIEPRISEAETKRD